MGKGFQMLSRGCILLAILVASALSEDIQCPGPRCFIFHQNIFASDTGYFEIEGNEGVSPEIEMGVTYRFNQSHESNWYLPLGFAYEPDGAHECLSEEGCPEVEHAGLKYFINGEESDLDTYEPEFEYPREVWLENEYYVELTIPESDKMIPNIFYFCHLHRGMSGRVIIKGAMGDPYKIPLYEPVTRTDFDKECGTYDIGQFEPGKGFDRYCPGQQFICGDIVDTRFGRCMNAIDCAMNHGMTIKVQNDNPIVVFMHQMIPHHHNAVNMAKILLKELDEDDNNEITEEEMGETAFGIIDEDLVNLLMNIVNTQNEQVTFMNTWLEENGYKRSGPDVPLCPSIIKEDAAAST